jgi:hypothetical protein
VSEKNVPVTKRASEIKPGDHVQASSLTRDGEGIAEVLHTTTFGAVGRETVHLLVSYSSRYEPDSIRLQRNEQVYMATDAEVADERAKEQRDKVADGLRELANLIADGTVPLERGGRMHIVESAPDVAALAAIGAALGIEVHEGTSRYRSVEWPKGHESYEDGLHVTWSAYLPKPAEAEPAAELKLPAPATS